MPDIWLEGVRYTGGTQNSPLLGHTMLGISDSGQPGRLLDTGSTALATHIDLIHLESRYPKPLPYSR